MGLFDVNLKTGSGVEGDLNQAARCDSEQATVGQLASKQPMVGSRCDDGQFANPRRQKITAGRSFY